MECAVWPTAWDGRTFLRREQALGSRSAAEVWATGTQRTSTAAGACLRRSVRASAVISTGGVPYAKYVGGSSSLYIERPIGRFACVHVRVSQSGSRIR